MTYKLNLIIFLVFVGVLGLNFYVDNESVNTKSSARKPINEIAAKNLTNVTKSKMHYNAGFSDPIVDTISNFEKLH